MARTPSDLLTLAGSLCTAGETIAAAAHAKEALRRSLSNLAAHHSLECRDKSPTQLLTALCKAGVLTNSQRLNAVFLFQALDRVLRLVPRRGSYTQRLTGKVLNFMKRHTASDSLVMAS